MNARRWPHLVSSAAGVFDRAVVAAIQASNKRERAHTAAVPHAARIDGLIAAGRAYEAAEVDAFFPAPPPCAPALRPVRAGVWEASWPSAAPPFLEAVAERWLSRIENRTARARLYIHRTSPSAPSTRPVVVLLHGYMGGHFLFEEKAWPVEWLVRRGFDVVIPLLPLHGARAGAHSGAPGFPSVDARLTNEGFRQAVTDVRSVVRFARDRGASAVGVMGMSLGGFTSALVATVVRPREIDFVVPMIPLASIADFAREQGRIAQGPEGDAEHGALDRANRVASPLARPLQLPPSRALVVAAEHDRITPWAHGARLATHFGCELLTIPGGHLLQLGRGDAFRAIGAMLVREGILPGR